MPTATATMSAPITTEIPLASLLPIEEDQMVEQDPLMIAGEAEDVTASATKGRPSYETYILPEYLKENKLPSDLTPFKGLIAFALDYALPSRSQKWRSRTNGKDGKPAQSGTNDQNPNTRVKNAANGYLLQWERQQTGMRTEGDWKSAREYVEELQYWRDQLSVVMARKIAYDAALEAYQGAAPERIVQ